MPQIERLIHQDFPPCEPQVIDPDEGQLIYNDYARGSFLSALQVTDEFSRIFRSQEITKAVVLGCGFGYEFPALRLWLGLGSKIWGIDRDTWYGKETDTHLNMQSGRAEYLVGDFGQVEEILKITKIPDFIWLRHPGPFRKGIKLQILQEEIESHYNNLAPWAGVITAHNIPFVVTMYRHETLDSFQFQREVLFQLFPKNTVGRRKKDPVDAVMIYDAVFPDFVILTVNAAVSSGRLSIPGNQAGQAAAR